MYAAERISRTDRENFRRIRRAETMRQQRERRRFVVLLLLTVLLVFGIGFGFGSLMTRAEEPEDTIPYKYYANIEIESGDTLWTIADDYMDSVHYVSRTDYINEVMTLNHMTTDQLISGQKIIVPYYSGVEK